MAKSIPQRTGTEDEDENDPPRYRIRVYFYDEENTWQKAEEEIKWSDEWSGWHMAAGPVIAPCGYSKIKYVADYASNRNEAFFDGLYLHKELFGRSYTYDNDHNLISTQSQSGLQDETTYDTYHTHKRSGIPKIH